MTTKRYIATAQLRGTKKFLEVYSQYGFESRLYSDASLYTREFTVHSRIEYTMLTSFLNFYGCKYTSSVIGGPVEDEVNYDKYSLPEMLRCVTDDKIVPEIIENITVSAEQQKKIRWDHMVDYKKIHTKQIYDDMFFLYASMVISDENHLAHDQILQRMFGYEGDSAEIHRLRSNLLKSRLGLPADSELLDLSRASLKKVREGIDQMKSNAN